MLKNETVLVSESRLRLFRLWLNILSWLLLILICIGTFYLYSKGYLTDSQKLKPFIQEAGIWGPVLFVLLQIIQVAIPILPGGVTTLAGVLIFGPFWGFIWNYVGICIGSILGFTIAKVYGRPILQAFFSPKLLETYEKKTNSDSQFAKYFALAIFLPIAPDDFLCYLAGTTSMSYQTFIKIILLGKPASILVYSLGLTTLLQKILGGG